MSPNEARALVEIGDLQAPAKVWLSAVMSLLAAKMDAGIDPSVDLEMGPVVVELRVMKVDGVWERNVMTLTQEHPGGAS